MSSNNLELRKASAGSGKTYHLTYRYINFLLADKGRLRVKEELKESIQHILAITFTNKATAEMKDRIISKLADLAIGSGVQYPEYLDQLVKDTATSEEQVRVAADVALKTLLNNYTDFQVSTIDSFFQTILRTFAYEVGKSDNYEIELDNDYVASTAVDTLLSRVNSKNPSKDVQDWIFAEMENLFNQKKKWNIFNKRGGDYGNGVYNSLIDAVKRMSSEGFRNNWDIIETYLKSGSVSKRYNEIYKAIIGDLNEKLNEAKKYARLVLRHVADYTSDDLNGYLISRAEKTINCNAFGKPASALWKPGDPEKRTSSIAFKSKFVKKGLSEADEQFFDYVKCMYDFYDEWLGLLDSRRLKTWALYSENFKMLTMMFEAYKCSAELLERNNIIEQSETNYILKKIVGDSDAPFVYERLGTKLNHFLIDEFQDTSKSQWDVLKPLVSNSLSCGNGNLIIGDAKQSIYRFRGAKPSIIQTEVSECFPQHVAITGDTRAENTNYRSRRVIVNFNNVLFKYLANRFDSFSVSENKSTDNTYFKTLYQNVEQSYSKKHSHYDGLVRVYSYDHAKATSDNYPKHYNDVVELICQLHNRGYRYNDIAVLTRTNKQGKSIMRAIMKFNGMNEKKTIPFVSEDSLTVSASASVKTIISALNLISNWKQLEDNNRKISQDLFECRCALFAIHHPNVSQSDLLTEFNNAVSDESYLDKLNEELVAIKNMSCQLGLPSIVEMLIKRMILPQDRVKQAPFIAALQDLVLDYCERYPSDISSFLQWWDKRGQKAGICSPASEEAVNVLTIHSSKGLQYRCVIIPQIDEHLDPPPYKNEWVWVQPDNKALALNDELAMQLPPLLPVPTTKMMADTIHAPRFNSYVKEFDMDIINTCYVAFTRAEDELYIFIDNHNRNNSLAEYISNAIEDHCVDNRTLINSEKEYIDNIAQFGEPLSAKEVLSGNKEQKKMEVCEEGYYVREYRDSIKYRNPNISNDYDDSVNYRDEGTKLHEILSSVIKVEDLEKAVKCRYYSGRLSMRECEKYLVLLKEKLDSVKEYGWFGTGFRVLNERSILKANEVDRRPDRVLIDDNKNAIVIDYKFGENVEKKYFSQVKGYMSALLKSGCVNKVKGYIWYLKLDKVIEVK